MKTILVISNVRIECEGSGTYPIKDYVKKHLDSAFNSYNKACDKIKADYSTTLPKYPSVEKEWFKFQDWLGVYNVMVDVLHKTDVIKKTFPNREGYIEVIKP